MHQKVLKIISLGNALLEQNLKSKRSFSYSLYIPGRVYPQSTCTYSRVPRVPQCLFPRPNWDPRLPLPQARVSPPGTKGGGHTRLRVRGWGSQFRRLEKKFISLSTLWVYLRTFNSGVHFTKSSESGWYGAPAFIYGRKYRFQMYNIQFYEQEGSDRRGRTERDNST
jgi:hypothetical protein